MVPSSPWNLQALSGLSPWIKSGAAMMLELGGASGLEARIYSYFYFLITFFFSGCCWVSCWIFELWWGKVNAWQKSMAFWSEPRVAADLQSKGLRSRLYQTSAIVGVCLKSCSRWPTFGQPQPTNFRASKCVRFGQISAQRCALSVKKALGLESSILQLGIDGIVIAHSSMMFHVVSTNHHDSPL